MPKAVAVGKGSQEAVNGWGKYPGRVPPPLGVFPLAALPGRRLPVGRLSRGGEKVASGGLRRYNAFRSLKSPVPQGKVPSRRRESHRGTHMQARFYLPQYHRFATPDTAKDQHLGDPQSWNLFSYVRDCPTMRIDPTGLYTWANNMGGNKTDEGVRAENSKEDADRIIGYRDQFRAGLKDAYQAADNLTNKTDAAFVKTSLDSYGKEGVDNHVTIANQSQGGGRTSTSGGVASVSFNFSSTNARGTAQYVAHEGRHVADYKSVMDFAKQKGVLAAYKSQFNLTQFAREIRGYNAAALVAQGQGQNTTYGTTELYSNEMGIDFQAIRRYVTEGYGVSNESPGSRYFEMEAKP